MARPSCPRHPDAKVWFDGSYGPPGRRRQRFKCVQPGGNRHVFTLRLPRQQAPHHDCLDCERPVARHEGPPAPRQQLYTVKEVAQTLLRVGQGITYRGAGRMLRNDARRLKVSKSGFKYPSRDSSVVEDWVEVFAPIVFEPHATMVWPPMVMLDDQPFDIRSTQNVGGKKIVFRIFAALGYDERLQRSVTKIEGFPDKSPSSWKKFLTSIPGRPQWIVCDNESGMLRGIELAWPHTPDEPSPVIWLCHFHLKFALQKLLYRHKKLNTPLADALDHAFQNRAQWDAFCQVARQSNFPPIEAWLDKPSPTWWAGNVSMELRIAWQLSHMKGVPTTTSALEEVLRWLRLHIKQRKFAFRNRERFNRLLMLMQLHLNGQANEGRYALRIRRVLEENGGHPANRRIITDPKGHYSLWV